MCSHAGERVVGKVEQLISDAVCTARSELSRIANFLLTEDSDLHHMDRVAAQ